MSEIVIWILAIGVLMFGDGVRIKECSSSYWLEIRENNIPADPITCVEFFASNSILWTLSASGAAAREYTCGPGSPQCVSTDADVNISRTNQGTGGSSVLTIVGNPRTLAGNGAVTCRESEQTAVAACFTNVISPATVTSCAVTHNGEDRTVSGSCQYQNAYSSNGTYTCTWYRQGPGQTSREHLATVNLSRTMTSDGNYYRGDCRLPSSPLPVAVGKYNYTVDFIPGPDRVLVGVITIDSVSTSSSSTAGPTSTRVNTHSTAVSETPTTAGPTSTSVTTKSAVVSETPTTAGSTSTSVTTKSAVVSETPTSAPQTESSTAPGGDDGFPLGAVIGGVVAVVVVVVVMIIVIIVVVIRRKRRKTPMGQTSKLAKVGKTTDSDEFEEHLNPIYGTEQEADKRPKSNFKPCAVALRISAGTDNGIAPTDQHHHHNGARDREAIYPERPSTMTDVSERRSAPVHPPPAAPVRQSSRTISPDSLYSSVDEDDSAVPAGNGLDVDEELGGYSVVGDPPGTAWSGPAAVEEDADAYAVIPTTSSKSPNMSTDAHQGYIYSVVNKSKAKATSSPPSNTTQTSNDIPMEDENAYAVVDLSLISPSPSSAQAEGSNNVYALVNKSAKRGHNLPSDQPNTEAVPAHLDGNVYAQVQKPKSSTKPKPDIKPKPKTDGKAGANLRQGEKQNNDQEASTNTEVVKSTQPTGAHHKFQKVTQNASTDDDYNTLNLFRRSEQPEEKDADDSTYSHLSRVKEKRERERERERQTDRQTDRQTFCV